jgi:hypothetical protein
MGQRLMQLDPALFANMFQESSSAVEVIRNGLPLDVKLVKIQLVNFFGRNCVQALWESSAWEGNGMLDDVHFRRVAPPGKFSFGTQLCGGPHEIEIGESPQPTPEQEAEAWRVAAELSAKPIKFREFL